MWAALERAPQNRVRNRRFWILLGSTFLAGLAEAFYSGIISNYAVAELKLGSARYGLLDGIRELPGLLAVVLAVATARLREEYAVAVWAALLGAGLWLHNQVGNYGELLLATLLFSTGLHLWSISRDVLVVDMAAPQERALRLGQVASAWAAASVAGMGLVSLLARPENLHGFFVAGGVLGTGAGVLSLLLRTAGKGAPPREPFVWRRQYRPLYLLTVLAAAREMVTLTLATYLLVQVHQLSVGHRAMLLTLQGLLSMLLRPLAGRLTDRLGDRR
ncbi:MAG TPA: MFS transporter, partial [Symbiobacteriaceae bacterium]|nr:MFS transporter [Symbiobacteriaceae bacterium]